MLKMYKIIIKITFAIILLAIGAIIYYAFRTDSLVMFNWADKLGLGDYVDKIRLLATSIDIPDFVKYCLPNALWTTSYILAADALISKEDNKLLWIIALPLVATILEFGQGIHIVSGTFDLLDILCYILPIVVYYLCYKI